MSKFDQTAIQELTNDIALIKGNFDNKEEGIEYVKNSFNYFFYIISMYNFRLIEIMRNLDEETKLKNPAIYINWKDKFDVFRIFNYNIYMLIKSILIMVFGNLLNSYGVLIRSAIEACVLSHMFVVDINEFEKWGVKTSYPFTGKNGVITKIQNVNTIKSLIGEELHITIPKEFYDFFIEHYGSYSSFTHGKSSVMMDMINEMKRKNYEYESEDIFKIYETLSPQCLVSIPIFLDAFLTLITYNAHIMGMGKLFEKTDFKEDIINHLSYFPNTYEIFSSIFEESNDLI